MPIPFHRTLRMSRKRGFKKTTSTIIAVLLESTLSSFQLLRYLPEKGAIIIVNNCKMLVFPRNGAIHKDLYLHKKREFVCTDYLIHNGVIGQGDVVLDIGSNIGYYALIESRLIGTKGKVYAVEPVQGNLRLLKKNLILNNLRNVQIFQVAIGEKNEQSMIYVSKCSNLCSMKIKTTGGKIVGEQRVSVENADTFLRNKASPDFIRMDVEGYEYEILKGMPETLKGNPKILVELHENLIPEKMDEIFQILRENNFGVRFAVIEGKSPENKFVSSLWQNAGVQSSVYTIQNASLQELRKFMDEHPNAAPNVLFEKLPTNLTPCVQSISICCPLPVSR